MPKTKVGVFDSGIGGLSVLNAVNRALPELELILESDKEHMPYGNRSIEEIYKFTKPLIQKLIDQKCEVIIIACNTVTTNLITQLRADFNVPFVGMEPMVRTAADLTRTNVVTVCATPRTLESDRYKLLKDTYATNIHIIEPDCSDWALMVENSDIDRDKIRKTIDNACDQNADQIVLGCTHYHWIEEEIKEMAAGRANILQPEVPVIAQLKTVLKQLS